MRSSDFFVLIASIAGSEEVHHCRMRIGLYEFVDSTF